MSFLIKKKKPLIPDLKRFVKKHLFVIKNPLPDKDDTEEYPVLPDTSQNKDLEITPQKSMKANNGKSTKNMEANNGKSTKSMEVKNGHNEISMEANSASKNDKNMENSEAGESPSCWKYPPSCIINVAEFLERAKSYTHLVVEGGLLEDTQEIRKIEKRIVSVFVVDKCAHKICRSTKDSDKITGVLGAQAPQNC